MATKRFGVDFDAATTPLTGTETLSIVQGGVTKDCTAQDIADLAPAGFTNPMTTAEDLIKGGVAGAATRLPVGTNGQVLTVSAGAVGWANPASGFTNPMTTAGDLIRGDTGGAAVRLGIGSEGQVLTVSGGVPAWAAASGGASEDWLDSIQEMRPSNNSSSWTVLGQLSPTVTGSARARLIETTNAATARPQIGADVTTPSATAVAGWRVGARQCFVGSGTSGGFVFSGGFSIYNGATNSSHRAFNGLFAAGTAPTDVNPSTLINMVGVGYDSADTNVQFFHNDGSGTATKIDTGIAKPTTNDSAGFLVKIECPPGGPINFTIREVVSGTTFSATASTDLPATTALIGGLGYASVGGVSSTIGIALYRQMVKTPGL